MKNKSEKDEEKEETISTRTYHTPATILLSKLIFQLQQSLAISPYVYTHCDHDDRDLACSWDNNKMRHPLFAAWVNLRFVFISRVYWPRRNRWEREKRNVRRCWRGKVIKDQKKVGNTIDIGGNEERNERETKNR